MKAVQIEKSGSLDDVAVREIGDAPLGPGEVRVAIEAAAVNPSDVAAALGKFPQQTLPRVLGRDFAGRVVEGPPEWMGREVWGSGGKELGLTRDGSHAQRMVIPAVALVDRPPQLSFKQAAAVGVPFLTAASALELGSTKSGEWVVVSGAAGAVGGAAVQIARAMGANPIALVREADDASPLEALGVPIARTERNDLAAVVRDATGGRGADVALNAVGAPVFGALFDALAHHGRMVVFSAAGGKETTLDLFQLYRKFATLLGLDTASFEFERVASTLRTLVPLFASGALKPPAVTAEYPLDRAHEAYVAVSAGTAGKIVLVP